MSQPTSDGSNTTPEEPNNETQYNSDDHYKTFGSPPQEQIPPPTNGQPHTNDAGTNDAEQAATSGSS